MRRDNSEITARWGGRREKYVFTSLSPTPKEGPETLLNERAKHRLIALSGDLKTNYGVGGGIVRKPHEEKKTSVRPGGSFDS